MNREWTRGAAIVLTIAATTILQAVTPPELVHWHLVLPRVYYIPIVFAALCYGWRGGLATALLSTAAFLPHVHAIGSVLPQALIPQYIEIAFYISVAVLTGILADREKLQKAKLRETAAQLAAVYDRLQSHFEGMKRAERLSALGQLSAGLAHEIRNPLASIAGAASILQRNQLITDAKYAKCLEIIMKESERLNGLLTNFLNFARPRPPNFQTVNVEAILDNVVALANHAIGRKNVDIQKQALTDIPAVDCDPEQLEQVLLNLVINAIEASTERSTVMLVADSHEDKIAIRVVDHGSGVAPEDIDRLFDPFFTTKETGTGLGLPVAHQIVGQMGGLLTAFANTDGGMTFSVTLPAKHRRAA